MSTKLEDLPDNDNQETNEGFGDDVNEAQIEDYDDGSDVSEEIKEPGPMAPVDGTLKNKIFDALLMISLMLFFANPLLVKGFMRIPFLYSVGETGVYVVLSIIAGILFFVIREFF
jgi:hypothetical protein